MALRLTGTPNKLHSNQSSLVQISTKSPGLTAGTTMVNFLPGIEGLITVWDSDTQLVLFADSETTATFWSPVIAGKGDDPLRNFWGLGSNQSIIVGGPYLVRGASLVGSKLALRGDLKTDVRLTVIAPKGIQSITWNGENVSGDVAASSAITQFGGFVGQLGLRKAVTGIKIPKLSWKFKDSLPEIQSSFNDGSWTIANRTTTNIPLKPYYGDGKILYGCDYGLSVTFSSFSSRMYLHVFLAARMSCFGEDISRLPVLRRALIYQSMAEKVFFLRHSCFPDLTSLSICCQCLGKRRLPRHVIRKVSKSNHCHFCAYIHPYFSCSTNNLNILEETDDKFIFPSGTLRAGEDNIITVVQVCRLFPILWMRGSFMGRITWD